MKSSMTVTNADDGAYTLLPCRSRELWQEYEVLSDNISLRKVELVAIARPEESFAAGDAIEVLTKTQ
jgi:hypothetical protein